MTGTNLQAYNLLYFCVTMMTLSGDSLTKVFAGQGMIKIRGDQCWRDLTCMNYHYEVCNRKQ